MKDKLFQIGLLFLVCAVVVAGLVIWTDFHNSPASVELQPVDEAFNFEGPLAAEDIENMNNQNEDMTTENPKAIFTTNKGAIEIELYEDVMPITVANFKKLANEGFYDGTKFHRVIDGFMIQAGDPNTKTDNSSSYGQGGPGYTIQDEFVDDPRLTNVRGTIAMANTGQPNSGGSQFFINTKDNVGLDFDNMSQPYSKHPVFGRVVNGMEVVDTISATETGPGDLPVEPIVIESIKVE